MLMKNILRTKRYLSSSCTKGKRRQNANTVSAQIDKIFLPCMYIYYILNNGAKGRNPHILPQGKIKKIFTYFGRFVMRKIFSLSEYLCQELTERDHSSPTRDTGHTNTSTSTSTHTKRCISQFI